MAARRDGCSDPWSEIKRTARSRTSGEYLFVVLLIMLHPAQKANPGRFRATFVNVWVQFPVPVEARLQAGHDFRECEENIICLVAPQQDRL